MAGEEHGEDRADREDDDEEGGEARIIELLVLRYARRQVTRYGRVYRGIERRRRGLPHEVHDVPHEYQDEEHYQRVKHIDEAHFLPLFRPMPRISKPLNAPFVLDACMSRLTPATEGLYSLRKESSACFFLLPFRVGPSLPENAKALGRNGVSSPPSVSLAEVSTRSLCGVLGFVRMPSWNRTSGSSERKTFSLCLGLSVTPSKGRVRTFKPKPGRVPCFIASSCSTRSLPFSLCMSLVMASSRISARVTTPKAPFSRFDSLKRNFCPVPGEMMVLCGMEGANVSVLSD